MDSTELKRKARIKRKKRIRKRVFGTTDRPRLSVFRSKRHIYAQLIDDSSGHTMAAASSVEKIVKDNPENENNISAATRIGQLIAERAIEKGVKKIVFDRNGFLYHGRIKAVSDGAREAGLEF